MKTMRLILSCLFALAMIPAAWAAPAHVHGEAKLEIVVDGGEFAIRFESPLDGLLGFERAPRTAAEKQAVQTMKATLEDAERHRDPPVCRVSTPEADYRRFRRSRRPEIGPPDAAPSPFCLVAKR